MTCLMLYNIFPFLLNFRTSILFTANISFKNANSFFKYIYSVT